MLHNLSQDKKIQNLEAYKLENEKPNEAMYGQT